jgi:hypothetical protein
LLPQPLYRLTTEQSEVLPVITKMHFFFLSGCIMYGLIMHIELLLLSKFPCLSVIIVFDRLFVSMYANNSKVIPVTGCVAMSMCVSCEARISSPYKK